MVNEPNQVTTLEVWYTLHILLPIQEVAELDFKVGRGWVQLVKRLQGQGIRKIREEFRWPRERLVGARNSCEGIGAGGWFGGHW